MDAEEVARPIRFGSYDHGIHNLRLTPFRPWVRYPDKPQNGREAIMRFIPRADQRTPAASVFTTAIQKTLPLTDNLFDTVPLPRAFHPLKWVPETSVHQALKITDKLRDTNQFLGTQSLLVRDELRQKTHILSIETDGLYLTTVGGDHLPSRTMVHAGFTRRAHLCPRKYDGLPLASYIMRQDGAHRLFVNGRPIQTQSDDLDFPYMVIQQPPVMRSRQSQVLDCWCTSAERPTMSFCVRLIRCPWIWRLKYQSRCLLS
jgi:hypothetical protein